MNWQLEDAIRELIKVQVSTQDTTIGEILGMLEALKLEFYLNAIKDETETGKKK